MADLLLQVSPRELRNENLVLEGIDGNESVLSLRETNWPFILVIMGVVRGKRCERRVPILFPGLSFK